MIEGRKLRDDAGRDLMTAFILNLDAIQLTDDQFYQLCQDNRDLRLELTSLGELIVMSPVGTGD
jgi:Uma2 family endonuclease